MQLVLGTIFTCGNLGPYLISYMRVRNNSTVTSAYIVWINALQTAGHGALMPFGGMMERRFGPRITGLVGSLTMSAGTALTYFTVDVSFPLVLLTYGLIFGFGISVGYIAMLSVGMKWFPNNKGLVNGIVVGGFGLGAFVFNQVQTAFLNPNNDSPGEDGYFINDEILDRVPYVFLLLGGVYTVLVLIGCALVTKPKEDAATASGEASLSPRQVLKTKEFYMLFFTLMLNIQTVTFFNAMYKAYGQTFISDDHFLALIGAFAAIFNAGGRITWGVLVDRYTYKKCMMALCSNVTALLLTMQLTPYGGKPMFAIWTFLLFFSMSASYTLIPTCTSRTFGPKHAGTNYGMIFFNAVFGAPATALISQFLSGPLGYVGMYYLLSGFLAISFLITCLFRERSVAEEIKKPMADAIDEEMRKPSDESLNKSFQGKNGELPPATGHEGIALVAFKEAS